MSTRESKSERQMRLVQMIEEDPLLTDELLAEQLMVSIQTIRLDRLELGVPEMRERARHLAESAQDKVKALGLAELTGELVDVELGKRGVSVLEATQGMAFRRSGIVRGHHLFAQGNSLAVAVIDAEVVLTGSARLKFHEPVRVGDRVVAKAVVKETRDNKSLVGVDSRVKGRLVFSGKFITFAVQGDAESERPQKGRRM